MGKPFESVEHLYVKHDIDGITVWVAADIDEKDLTKVKIGFRKFLFFGDLFIDGISTKVFVE